jgi:hypothetical protein
MNLEVNKTQAHYLLALNRDRQRLLSQAITPSNSLQSTDVEYKISIDIEQSLIDLLTEEGEAIHG